MPNDQLDEGMSPEIGESNPPQPQVFDEEGVTLDDDDAEAMKLFESMDKEDGKDGSVGGAGDGRDDDVDDKDDGNRDGRSGRWVVGGGSVDGDGEGESGADLTASQIAEKRARELAGEPPEDDSASKGGDAGQAPDEQTEINAAIALLKAKGIIAESAPQSQARQDPSPQGEKPAGQKRKISREQIVSFLNDISDDELPDEMIEVVGNDGNKYRIKLKDYAEDLPEQWHVTKMLAGAVVRSVLGKMVESGQIITSDQANELKNNLTAQSQQSMYWMQMLSAHPDALKIQQDKGFVEWMSSKSKGWQAMANSWDPNDGILVLNAYKEEVGRTKAKKFDARQAEGHQKKVDIHRHTARGSGGAKKADAGGKSQPSTEADEEKLFNEAAAKFNS